MNKRNRPTTNRAYHWRKHMARLTVAVVTEHALSNGCTLTNKSVGYTLSNGTLQASVGNLKQAMEWIDQNGVEEEYEVPETYTREILERDEYQGAELSMIAADGFNIDLDAFTVDGCLDADRLIDAILAAQSLAKGEEIEAERIPPQLKPNAYSFTLQARKFLDRWVLAMVAESDPKVWTWIEDCQSEEEARANVAQQIKDCWTY